MLTVYRIIVFLWIFACFVTSLTVDNLPTCEGSRDTGPHSIPIARYIAVLTEKAVLRTGFDGTRVRRRRSVVASLNGISHGEGYVTEIGVGNKTYKVAVDTGSSDTWLVHDNFQCFDAGHSPISASHCAFRMPGYEPTMSNTFISHPNTHFKVGYGSKEFAMGPVGLETISIAGMVVQQEIGVAVATYWNGDGISTGLLGLAYPGMTSAFRGTDLNEHANRNKLHYNSFIFSAIQQGVINKPIFSVALHRVKMGESSNVSHTPDLGFLAFGGVPPVSVMPKSTTVPIRGFPTSSGHIAYLSYTVCVDAYIFSGSDTVSMSSYALLDTGTDLNYVPGRIADSYNALWHPPARRLGDDNLYYVDCAAIPPPLSIRIGGVDFSFDPRDLTVISFENSADQKCLSAIQERRLTSKYMQFILGSSFLHNVVASFDVVENTATIMGRSPY